MATAYPMPALDPAVYTAREVATIRRSMRLLERGLRSGSPVLGSPIAAGAYLRLWIGAADREIFAALFLDTQNRLIEAEELFRGTLAETSVYPREVLRFALRHNAASVLLAHNHPSGAAEPSVADRTLTTALRDALALVDVRVADHLIVTRSATYSFADHGLL
ncbi:RadC-like JAB domain [Thiomonas bhubaneswarensis]|uniref:RadC-like JAB domain n=2 Tax=Thiomonas bhubaneswarensis TaxID=339866 RepID=A0A0K6I585_9BURK|nr:RadC-like JAB domain [Thiomonas bhubaneswarensis]